MSDLASNLLRKLDNTKDSTNIKKSTKECISDISSYLCQLRSTHVKRDYLSNPTYLISMIYGPNTVLKNNAEVNAFYKCSLVLAEYFFEQLVKRISSMKGGVNYYNSLKHIKHFHDFIFDVADVVDYFERKNDPSFEFLSGGKSYTHQSWRINAAANRLFWADTVNNSPIEHRIAILLSGFSLRQSLEIKFRRMIGVENIFDKDYKSPKLRHDYFPDFINHNLEHFTFEYDSLTNINHIYKWTNSSIHTGNMPRIWEAFFAVDYCNPLFNPKQTPPHKSWSIHNAIKLERYNELLLKLHNQVATDYPSTLWGYHMIKPEAVIKSY